MLRWALLILATALLVTVAIQLPPLPEHLACANAPAADIAANCRPYDSQADATSAARRTVLLATAFGLSGLLTVGLTLLFWNRLAPLDAQALATLRGTRARVSEWDQRRVEAANAEAAVREQAEMAIQQREREAAAARAEAQDPAFHALRERLARGEITPAQFNELRAHLAATRPLVVPSPIPVQPTPQARGLTAWGVFWAIVGAVVFLTVLGILFTFLFLGALLSSF